MYGTLSYLSYLWDLKEQKRREDALKSSFGVAMQVIGRVGGSNWQDQKCKLKCLKFIRLTLNYSATLISACTHVPVIQTPLPTTSQEYNCN